MQRERQKYQQDQELPVTTHKNTGYDVNAGSESNIRVGGEINTTDGVKMDGFVPLNGKTEKTTGFSVGGPVAVTPGGIPLSGMCFINCVIKYNIRQSCVHDLIG